MKTTAPRLSQFKIFHEPLFDQNRHFYGLILILKNGRSARKASKKDVFVQMCKPKRCIR